MNSVYVIEIWDKRGKRWLPLAFNWYTEAEGEMELSAVRAANRDDRVRLMQYIPITQAANEVARQREAREKLQANAQPQRCAQESKS